MIGRGNRQTIKHQATRRRATSNDNGLGSRSWVGSGPTGYCQTKLKVDKRQKRQVGSVAMDWEKEKETSSLSSIKDRQPKLLLLRLSYNWTRAQISRERKRSMAKHSGESPARYI